MTLALELEDIQAGYGDMPAIFSVNVAVPKGSVVALLGPNGAGKTTSLRVSTGIVGLTRGKVVLHGEDVTKHSTRALAKKGLCMIPEGRGIFPTLTVRENLLVQTYLRGRGTNSQIQEIAFGRFPILGDRRNQLAGTLSGGEQQMLALSRALTSNPSVILLDEISMGLAPLIVEQIFEVVRQLASEGMTILIVEQFIKDALELADYVYLMNQGRIRCVGEPEDIREEIVNSYLGGASDATAVTTPISPTDGDADSDDDASYVTLKGTRAHWRTCAVLVGRSDVRVNAAEDLLPCGLCHV